MEYKIQLLWDNEASVWVATSPDVPGLVDCVNSFSQISFSARWPAVTRSAFEIVMLFVGISQSI